jgi:hypothetical protein
VAGPIAAGLFNVSEQVAIFFAAAQTAAAGSRFDIDRREMLRQFFDDVSVLRLARQIAPFVWVGVVVVQLFVAG